MSAMKCEACGERIAYQPVVVCDACGRHYHLSAPSGATDKERINELEDHYRGAREIIEGERLRREEAERVSLKAQARVDELEAQVKELKRENARVLGKVARFRRALETIVASASEGGWETEAEFEAREALNGE